MEPSRYLRWFDTTPSMGRVSANNEVTFFTTGEDAFDDLGSLLEVEAGPTSTVLILGWSFTTALPMQAHPTTPGLSTLEQLLSNFTAQGGSAKAMLWKNTIMPGTGGTTGGAAFINGLPRSQAILDNRTPLAGTHHQKIQAIVGSRAGTAGDSVAYCGGMDLFDDRVGPGALHDVHCKVVGDGSVDLVNVFTERWNDHPDHTGAYTPTLTSGPAVAPFTDLVQVCRTYPQFPSGLSGLAYSIFVNKYLPTLSQVLSAHGAASPGDMRVAGQTRYYSFYRSDTGVQQIWRAVRRAIDQAEKFIYLEDQYLVNPWVGQALAAKLASAGKDFRIVILALHPDLADIQQVWPRRRALLAPLIAADPRRVRWQIFTRNLGKDHPYVHSKTWIFDDELVITGSANLDRRGYTYNSEADVVVAGAITSHHEVPSGATTKAQDLRCRLFAKHLGGKASDYLDHTKALAAWRTAGTGSHVVVFNPDEKPGAPDKYVAQLTAASTTTNGVSLALAAMGLLGGADAYLWDNLEDPDPDVRPPSP